MSINKKITIITGHFGSGKSEFAIQWAKELRKKTEESITLIDLDLVNPYFRSREKKEALSMQGIEVIASDLPGEASDIPSLSPRIQKIFHPSGYSVIDLGGDPMGATALKRYTDLLKEMASEIDVWFICNCYRPQTSTIESAVIIAKALEKQIQLPITGVVNTTHLLKATSVEDVLIGAEFAEKVALALKVEMKYNVAIDTLLGHQKITKYFPLSLSLRDEWMS